jgi:hypothetical protein
MNSAVFLLPKPLMDWLPSLYIFMPIFIFYFLYVLNYKAREVAISVALVSIIVALLLQFDRLSNLSILDDYERVSTFFFEDKRRIVLLKNEVIFGFSIFISLFLAETRSKNIWLGLGLMLFLVQALIMESRMGFLAMFVASVALLYLRGMSKKILRIYVVAAFSVVVAFPIVFENYIGRLSEMSLFDRESNISVRIESIAYYYDLYIENYGMGFGMMSPSGSTNNVLYTGVKYNLADTGFFSALFQFGPLGLILWGWFTYRVLTISYRYYKKSSNGEPYSAAVFSFLIGFTISLLPLSFFTQSWCINTGGLILYMVWYYERKQLLGFRT